jgi:hypothetical protein
VVEAVVARGTADISVISLCQDSFAILLGAKEVFTPRAPNPGQKQNSGMQRHRCVPTPISVSSGSLSSSLLHIRRCSSRSWSTESNATFAAASEAISQQQQQQQQQRWQEGRGPDVERLRNTLSFPPGMMP